MSAVVGSFHPARSTQFIRLIHVRGAERRHRWRCLVLQFVLKYYKNRFFFVLLSTNFKRFVEIHTHTPTQWTRQEH